LAAVALTAGSLNMTLERNEASKRAGIRVRKKKLHRADAEVSGPGVLALCARLEKT
jgi:hypothetical protein